LGEAHSYFHAHTSANLSYLKEIIHPPSNFLSHWCCHVEPCCFFESIDRPDESFTVKEIHIRSIPPTAVRFE